MTGHVIHLDRQIYAAPQDVWDMLTDVANATETFRHVSDVRVLAGGQRFAAGLRWRERRPLMGHQGVQEVEVVEAWEPRHFALRIQRSKDVLSITFTLSPLRTGTRLSLTLVDDMSRRGPAGKLGWHLWGEISLQATRRMLLQDLEDVAVAAESLAVRRLARRAAAGLGPDGG